MSARLGRWLPLAAVAVTSAFLYAVAFRAAPGVVPTRTFPWLHLPLFAGYLVAVGWVLRKPGLDPRPILVAALVLRLAALVEPPALSSDCHRYAWDGRVQRAGINPYRHAPADPALASLRDEHIYPRINRPTARTVYPPGSELLYVALPDSVTGLRLAMIGFDTLTGLLLVGLLRRLYLDPARVVVYAWCPLVVAEVGNNGHVDAAMVAALVAAVLMSTARRDGAAGLLLGVAASMKLYPALAAVALARRRPVLVLGAMFGILSSLYLVYGWGVGVRVAGFLPEYVGSAEDHNIGLRRLLEALVPATVPHPREVAFGGCVVAFVVGVAWIAQREWPVPRMLLALIGWYLFTLPTAFHPWYALWLVPWLAVHPTAGWFWLLGTLPFSYLKYGSSDATLPAWVVPLEWMPTLALLWLVDGTRGAPSGDTGYPVPS